MRDKYTGELATRVALADEAAIDQAIASSVERLSLTCSPKSRAGMRAAHIVDGVAPMFPVVPGLPTCDHDNERIGALLGLFRSPNVAMEIA